ncbi:MAG TPA: zinc-finger domain-containing protein [Proteobacteria bacterium]|nr:zinc-finger domain-containing protein [Pseudomonadota bacterium]
MTRTKLESACSRRVIEVVSGNDLCCPPRNSHMWNAHPRVYLPIEKGMQSTTCYYCGTVYVLKEKT